MIVRRLGLAAMAVGLSLVVGACGERPQVLDTGNKGVYQGKQDKAPYVEGAYAGDKSKWEKDLVTRNQYQNEYKRTR